MNYTVVIPVLNQLRYTKQCVDSLLAHGVPADALLVIDNGSSDDTPAWLASRPDIRSIRNPVNLGCGGAGPRAPWPATATGWCCSTTTSSVRTIS